MEIDMGVITFADCPPLGGGIVDLESLHSLGTCRLFQGNMAKLLLAAAIGSGLATMVASFDCSFNSTKPKQLIAYHTSRVSASGRRSAPFIAALTRCCFAFHDRSWLWTAN